MGLPDDHGESDLHSGLLARLKTFLTELGRDFCFIGSEFPLQVIVESIREKAAQFDELVEEAQTTITLLQGHRAALISAAVTGQIDARGVVAAKRTDAIELIATQARLAGAEA